MFKNIRKERELINREVELYRKEQFLEIDKEIEKYRADRNHEVQKMGRLCMKQLGEYKHEFHSTKEAKGIELAKLQAKCEAMKETVKAREEVIAADNNYLEAKKAEITRLNKIINLLIENQPETTIQQLK